MCRLIAGIVMGVPLTLQHGVLNPKIDGYLVRLEMIEQYSSLPHLFHAQSRQRLLCGNRCWCCLCRKF